MQTVERDTPSSNYLLDGSEDALAQRRVRKRKKRWISKQSLSLVVPGVFVALIAVLVVAGDHLAPHDPNDTQMARRFEAPSSSHIAGTDDLGRDVFSRILVGTRYSLLAAILVLTIASAIGSCFGVVAGFLGGRVDNLIMRITDLTLAFPALILAMAVAAVMGPSLISIVVAIAVVWWPNYARLVRGQALSVREEPFIVSARAIGATEWRIVFRHVVPQCGGVIVARATVDIGSAIILTSTLGFLGLGVPPPRPEWGSMIAQARPFFFSAWWTVVFPGLAILSSVLILSIFADAVNEVLAPDQRGAG